MLDWSYKADKGTLDPFIKMSNRKLVECYRSYLRIAVKRECKHELYNDILQVYEEKIESNNPSKIAKLMCRQQMFDEIARRFSTIIRLSDGFWD